MDELVIEDKKYISSKRAADITGYAKDYVGQLCREGYVKARRVGRNWYVLESAIKDHRFGNAEQTVSVEPASEAMVPPTWEAPRYEPVMAAPLPSINRLQPVTPPIEEDVGTEPEPVGGDFQDAWQGWFESFKAPERQPAPEPVYEPVEPVVEEETVPLHRMPVPEVPPTPEVPRPRHEARLVLERPHQGAPPRAPRHGPRFGSFALQTALIVVALFFAGAAVFGTGYLDTAPVTSSQLSRFSGMSVLEKASK